MDRNLQLREAVASGNKKRLNNLLECRTLAETKATPELAQVLLTSLVSSLDDATRRFDGAPLSFQELFQGLLMIYPHYDAPWKAIDEVSVRFHVLDWMELVQVVTTMEVFFQQFSKESTIIERYAPYLLRFTVNTVDFVERPKRNQRRALNQLLGNLVGSIVSVSRQRSEIVDAIVEREPAPSRVLDWMQMVACLSQIEPTKMDKVGTKILEYLSQPKLPFDDLPEIVRTAMEITSYSEPINRHRSLRQIPLQALAVASRLPKVYHEIEETILTSLQCLPLSELNVWINVMQEPITENCQHIPEWTRLATTMITIESLKGSGSSAISSLIGHAFGRSTDVDEVLLACYKFILNMAFSNVPQCDELLQGGSSTQVDQVAFTEMFDDLVYTSRGDFEDCDGRALTALTHLGRGIKKAVFAGEDTYCALHTKRWLEAANEILDADKLHSTKAALFVVVLSTVMFFEESKCRPQVLAFLAKRLARSQQNSTRSTSCVSTVVLLARSLQPLDMDVTSPSLEPICNLLSHPMHIDLYNHLVSSLSAMPGTQAFILATSRQMLDQAYTSGWGEGDGHALTIRRGLFGLIELIRRPTWGECELEAWSHFSDSYVMDMPPLPLSERTWVYRQIEDLIHNDELPLPITEHLLRASITRASTFFRVRDTSWPTFFPDAVFFACEDPQDPSGFCATQFEDPVEVLRLIQLLVCNVADSSTEGNSLLTHGVESLLPSLLAWDGRQHQSRSSPAIATANNHLVLFCKTSRLLVAHVVDYLVASTESSSVSCEASRQQLHDCFAQIVAQEAGILRRAQKRQRSKMPSWLQHSGRVMNNKNIPASSLGSVQLGLFDFILEILLLPNLKGKSLSDLKSNCRRLVQAVGQLLQNKSKLARTLPSTESREGSIPIATVDRTAVMFLSAATLAVQEVFSQKCELCEAEDTFDPILQYCRLLGDLPDEAHSRTKWDILQSLWSLYQVACSESGAIRFIAFLESNSAEGEGTTRAKADSSICSLRTIKSGEDIDNSVQAIRLSVVKAMASCLRCCQDPNPTNSVVGQGMQTTDGFSEVNTSFIAGILRALAHDLWSGLKGESGGITPELYVMFNMVIAECSTALYQGSLSLHVQVPSGTLNILSEASEMLSAILASYPVDDAVIYRSSFILAAAELPCIAREILRRMLVVNPDLNLDIDKLFDLSSSCITQAFHDAILILKRWSSLRDPSSIPWEDIAGDFHVKGDTTETRDRSHSARTPEIDEASETIGANNDVPLIVEVPIPEFHRKARKVRLRTKEIWSWTLSCGLVTVEEQWLESLRVVVHGEGLDRKTRATPCPKAFFASRRAQLSTSLQNIANFFQSSASDAELHISTKPKTLEMLAMNLPSAPKQRLCCALQTIANVLSSCIQLLHSHLRDYNSGMVLDLSFLESLCCLSSWLSLEGEGSDFAVGTWRWHSIERHRHSRGKPQRNSSARIVGPAPKLESTVHSAQHLYGSLRKLDVLLGKWKGSHTFHCPMFEEILGGGLEHFRRLTRTKLKALGAVLPAEDISQSLPDFPEMKANMKRQRPASLAWNKRPAKRQAKSRNPIVNEFRRMDQSGSGSRDYDTRDAFVDLEDFLAPG